MDEDCMGECSRVFNVFDGSISFHKASCVVSKLEKRVAIWSDIKKLLSHTQSQIERDSNLYDNPNNIFFYQGTDWEAIYKVTPVLNMAISR